MSSDLTQSRRRTAGFTILEVLFVVAIIGVLAAVAMPAYFNHMMRSRQSAAIGELMVIKGAQERYFAENGGFAGKLNMLDKYAGADPYQAGFYRYWVTANTNAMITAGTIRATGDLNGDGNFNDGWEVSIQNFEDKPKPYATGGDEGFSWSSLAHLF